MSDDSSDSSRFRSGSPFDWEREDERPLRPMAPVVRGVPPEPVLPPERPTPEPRTQHFVAFQLIDDETEEPIPDVEIAVRLPSGDLQRERTDGNGRVRFDGIDPGACAIEGSAAAEVLEVVRLA